MTRPAVLYAEHTDEHGQTWSLALVRTRWADEGQCVLERTVPPEKRETDNAVDGIDLVEQGAWFARGGNEGPCELRVEIPGLEDDLDAREVDRLLAKLVGIGGEWGIESFEAVS